MAEEMELTTKWNNICEKKVITNFEIDTNAYGYYS